MSVNVLFVPGAKAFCLSPGDKQILYTVVGGTNIFQTQVRDKLFAQG